MTLQARIETVPARTESESTVRVHVRESPARREADSTVCVTVRRLSDDPEPTVIPLNAIQRDPDTQSRVQIDSDTVSEYSEMIEDMDAIILYRDPAGMLYIGDGHHRIAAAEKAGGDSIRAIVRQGTKRDAVFCALGINKHGLQPTIEDRRKAVMTMLDDPEWAKWSNHAIARHCGSKESTVRNYRKQHENEASLRKLRSEDRAVGGEPTDPSLRNLRSEDATRTYVDRYGNVREMKTGAIGQRPEPSPSQPQGTIGHAHGAASNLTIAPPAEPCADGLLPIPIECMADSNPGPNDRPPSAPPLLSEAEWTRPNGKSDEPTEEVDDIESSAELEQESADPDAWIHALPIYDDLPAESRSRTKFAHDCRLWEAGKDHFHTFRDSMRPLLDAARIEAMRGRLGISLDNDLSLFDQLTRILKVVHPRYWRVCKECSGAGEGGFGQPCGSCRSKGYRVH